MRDEEVGKLADDAAPLPILPAMMRPFKRKSLPEQAVPVEAPEVLLERLLALPPHLWSTADVQAAYRSVAAIRRVRSPRFAALGDEALQTERRRSIQWALGFAVTVCALGVVLPSPLPWWGWFLWVVPLVGAAVLVGGASALQAELRYRRLAPPALAALGADGEAEARAESERRPEGPRRLLDAAGERAEQGSPNLTDTDISDVDEAGIAALVDADPELRAAAARIQWGSVVPSQPRRGSAA